MGDRAEDSCLRAIPTTSVNNITVECLYISAIGQMRPTEVWIRVGEVGLAQWNPPSSLKTCGTPVHRCSSVLSSLTLIYCVIFKIKPWTVFSEQTCIQSPKQVMWEAKILMVAHPAGFRTIYNSPSLKYGLLRNQKLSCGM